MKTKKLPILKAGRLQKLVCFTTLLFTGISAVQAQAPATLWAQKYGSTTADRSRSIAVDASGNVYTAGFFNGTATFGALGVTSAGATDGYVSKTNAAGTVVWVKNFGGTSNDEAFGVAVDPSGNVFITGEFQATATFGSTSLTASGGSGITNGFLAKLSAAGNFLWAQRFGGTNPFSHGESVACDASGNVFVAGRFNSGTISFGSISLTGSGGDAFIAKYNSGSTAQWAKLISGTSTEYASFVTTDVFGSAYVTGQSFSATTTFDSFSLTGGSSRAYTVKVNSSGTAIWANGSPNANGTSLATDANANVYTIGTFSGTSTFGAYAATSSGGGDVFITKTSSGGFVQWLKAVGSTSNEVASSIAANTDGVYALFTTGGATTIVGTTNAVAGNYVVKLTPATGVATWTKKFGDSNDAGAGIGVSTDGNIYYTGYLTGTAAFDAITLSSYGSEDIFLTKLAVPCVNKTTTLTPTACTSYTLNGITYTASGTYTQVRTAFGGCDSTLTINLTIGDVIAPVANVTTLPDVTGQCSVTSLTAPTATDNCSGSITGVHNAALPITTPGTTLVTWTYTDAKGNSATQTQNVVIADNTAPVPTIALLPAVTAQCSVTALTAPAATDNCSGAITGVHNATLPISTQGTTVVTWTYTDASGNSSTQLQNVIITDNAAPVADMASLPAITDVCSVALLPAPTATDNCSGAITGTHNATLPITTPGTTVVTWTYNDGNGNTSTQTQNVIISDNIAPMPDASSLADINSLCSVTSLTAPTATDNCTGAITATHNVTLPVTASGTTIVTWTYNDGHGNTSTQTQNINITDNVAPVPATGSLADITGTCSVTSLTAPTATDNCAGTVTATGNVTLPVTAQGLTVVIWSYNDGHGNISTQTQNVFINDNVAPVPNMPALTDVTAQCSVAFLPAPTATDNCVGAINGTHNAVLPITTQGTTVVTWTYNDGHGNTATQTQNVIIADITAPVPNQASLANVSAACSVTALTAPTATDNCAGTITATHNATLPIIMPGTTVVTWTYSDGNGNTATQTQNVSITVPDATTTSTGLTITATTAGAGYQWLDCNNGNAPVAGATSQSFTATMNGSYAVEVTESGCTATSTCTVISTVDIDEMTNAEFGLYPNPNAGTFTVAAQSAVTVTITTVTGQIVSTQTLPAGESKIEMGSVESGIYFVSLQNESGAVAVKRLSVIR